MLVVIVVVVVAVVPAIGIGLRLRESVQSMACTGTGPVNRWIRGSLALIAAVIGWLIAGWVGLAAAGLGTALVLFGYWYLLVERKEIRSFREPRSPRHVKPGPADLCLRKDREALLSVRNLTVEFPAGRKDVVHAVSGVSFDIVKGETLGIVGESGCGKSTVAKTIIRLNDAKSGVIEYQGRDLAGLQSEALRRIRPNLQMIFQDPISSLNPRRRIRDVISEGLAVWADESGSWSEDRINELMVAVGIDPGIGDRRPHQFSGGQCQRIGVARALALDPKVLICDEPVSALDVSVQAQILNLLQDMKQRYGLTLMFISHDLSVVKNVSDRIMVMYLGKVCEIGNANLLYSQPRHPYTRALLASIPEPAPTVDVSESDIAGDLPSPINPPGGCRFHTRCGHATDLCSTTEPTMTRVGDDDHHVACHHPVEVSLTTA